MTVDHLTALLPVLSRSLEPGFNVFDVMHHGTYEKQISNVFRWLLEAEGTHGLGDAFVRIFIDQVNRSRTGLEPLEPAGYVVRQEVNITEPGGAVDIADLVLESQAATLVIENYVTSDGHGHGYNEYLQYSRRGGREGAVVMLCHETDRSQLTNGWEGASVVTYGSLLETLRAAMEADRRYRAAFPEPYSFIDQMHRKFVKGSGRMEDRKLLDFVVAMCDTGEAARYAMTNSDQVAEQFAADMAVQARERFGEGRELLQRVKDRLKAFSSRVLLRQVNTATSGNLVRAVAANYRGKWQWEIILHLEDAEGVPQDNVQLVFGPSAWHAQSESAPVPIADPDYSRIFLYRHSTKAFRQSAVTLKEVLDGLGHDDLRLRDEILQLVMDYPPEARSVDA